MKEGEIRELSCNLFLAGLKGEREREGGVGGREREKYSEKSPPSTWSHGISNLISRPEKF